MQEGSNKGSTGSNKETGGSKNESLGSNKNTQGGNKDAQPNNTSSTLTSVSATEDNNSNKVSAASISSTIADKATSGSGILSYSFLILWIFLDTSIESLEQKLQSDEKLTPEEIEDVKLFIDGLKHSASLLLKTAEEYDALLKKKTSV